MCSLDLKGDGGRDGGHPVFFFTGRQLNQEKRVGDEMDFNYVGWQMQHNGSEKVWAGLECLNVSFHKDSQSHSFRQKNGQVNSWKETPVS